MRFCIHWIFLVWIMLLVSPAQAQFPVSGKPIPALSFLEPPILQYMEDNQVNAVIVGISHMDEIIYLRGFGWKNQGFSDPLQETTTFRTASVNKTFTAAVTRDLVRRGLLNLTDFAFDLGQPQGGILNIEPFPEIGDPRLAQVTVGNLLDHKGGWDRDETGDWTRPGIELIMKNAMDLPQLPTKEQAMSWILGKELVENPGSIYHYSNEGYLALGLVVEEVSGTDLLSYVRTHLLTDDLWFPATDIFMGNTFAEDLDPREPYYASARMMQNVFDPDGPQVRAPYGSWNHAMKDGYGRIVSSAVPLLHQAGHFVLDGENRGMPLPTPWHVTENHGGAQAGTRVELWQGSDGVDMVIFANRYEGEVLMAAQEIRDLILTGLSENSFTWPHESIDCRWVDFADPFTDREGSYDHPYAEMEELGNVPSYSKVKFKSGSTDWTGVFTRGHLAFSAEEGATVIIGQQ